MSTSFLARNWAVKPIQFGLIAIIVLAGSAFVLMSPSLTWCAAAAAVGGLLTLGLAVGDMRKVFLTALAFLIPFYIHKALFVRENDVGEIVSLSVAVADIILLVLFFLWMADMALDKHYKLYLFPSVTAPACVWILASALSVPRSIDPVAAVFQLVLTTKILMMYLVVANQIRVTSDTAYILVALLAGLFLQSILGVYQAWSGQSLGLWFLGESSKVREFALDIGSAARPHGTLGHSNGLAMYLNMLLCIAFTILFAEIKIIHKLVIGLAFFMGILALVLTLSRGAWLGFSVGLAAVLFFLVRRGVIRARGGLSILAWVTLALLVSGVAFSGLIASRLRSSDEGASASRLLLMQSAIAMIEDHPSLGVGLDNYALAAREYNPSEIKSWEIGQTYVHNAFLLIGAEVGLVGLAAFVWLSLALLKQGLHYVRREPVNLNWLIGLGIFAGILSVLIHSQADYALVATPSLTILFWFLVGWLMVIGKNAEAQMRRGEIER